MNRLLFRQKLNHLREDALRFQNTLSSVYKELHADHETGAADNK